MDLVDPPAVINYKLQSSLLQQQAAAVPVNTLYLMTHSPDDSDLVLHNVLTLKNLLAHTFNFSLHLSQSTCDLSSIA